MTKPTASKTSTLIPWIVAAVLAIGAALVLSLVTSQQHTSAPHSERDDSLSDSEQFARDYEGAPDDHRFVYASSEQVLDVFKSGSGVVFLGFPECPWCQQVVPILDEAAKAEGVDGVLYLNIRQARGDNDAVYQQLVDALSGHLRTDDDGNPRIYVPDISVVRDGEIVGHFVQETVPDGEAVTPDTYWTDERRERGVEQLREMMRKL